MAECILEHEAEQKLGCV